MKTVKFIEVGRNKRTWEKQLPEPIWDVDLARIVAKSGALLSKGIDVELSEDGKSGVVIVGGFRTVGRIEISDAKEAGAR